MFSIIGREYYTSIYEYTMSDGVHGVDWVRLWDAEDVTRCVSRCMYEWGYLWKIAAWGDRARSYTHSILKHAHTSIILENHAWPIEYVKLVYPAEIRPRLPVWVGFFGKAYVYAIATLIYTSATPTLQPALMNETPTSATWTLQPVLMNETPTSATWTLQPVLMNETPTSATWTLQPALMNETLMPSSNCHRTATK